MSPQIKSERSDDIPLIIHWVSQMKIKEWVDEVLPSEHGNRQGLSYGQLTVLMLSYIMSQADHRLCAIESWVKEHHQTLERCTGWEIGLTDASDDRLAALLEVFGKHPEQCDQLEIRLSQHLIQAYALPTEVARADTTSFSVHHHQQAEADPDSLLQYGRSKDHRPDLLQYRQMLATLDPLGMPLVSQTLAGNGADDPLYVGIWERLVKVIGHRNFVFVADCKAGALATRAQIAQQGGVYCVPLAETGQVPAMLKTWVLNPPNPLQVIRLPHQKEDEIPLGVGFEMDLGKQWLDESSGTWGRWMERHLVVQSYALAERQLVGIQTRLKKAELALAKLAAKPYDDCCQLTNQAQAILKRYQLQSCFELTISAVSKPVRPNRKQDSATDNTQQFILDFQVQPQAIEAEMLLAGWRIYVTNGTLESLSLPQAMAYYREQWQPEQGFHRFKRGRLPALPIYLQNEDRIVGLMLILTIALRLFTLVEYVVRQSLLSTDQQIAGLYEGNPQRTTERPSTEQLLKAFRNITFYQLPDGSTFMTPLNALQTKILALMKVPESIYGFA